MRTALVLAALIAGSMTAIASSRASAAAQTPTPGPEAVLVGAGDIASCTNPGDQQTADLLALIPGTVATFGDNAYESGSADEYANCYNPTWGAQKSRTKPAPGNHEYITPGATGYYGYFGAAAGDPATGYYSYNLGAWHVVVLNSNCAAVGGCDAASPQVQWLRADLAAHPSTCTLAYWHHPRFSSGQHGSDATFQPFWQALYDFGADIVLVGHDHDYERFALQDPSGHADPQHGIRQFVVGTGGRSHYVMGPPIANSEVQNGDTFGVLQLSLHPTGYDWQFIHVFGATFTDSGSGTCVSAAPVGGLTALTGATSGGAHAAWLEIVAGMLLGAALASAAWGLRRRARTA